MQITLLLQTALRAIYKHKIRSFLTILGIMIGVGAIIITFSIGSGAEKKVQKQILAMGENAVFILPGDIIDRGSVRSSSANPSKLQEKDVYALKQQIPEIDKISRGLQSLQLIEFGGNAVMQRIFGTDENALRINDNKLKRGTFFTEDDVKNRINVAVIGKEVAENLFKNGQDPIGKTIRIAKKPFTVIGIMDHIDFFWGTDNPNTRIYVPYSVAKKYYKEPGQKEEDLGFIALNLKTPKTHPTLPVIRKIKRVLRFMHDLDEEDKDDFIIFDQQSTTESAQEASGVIKMFALIAASISLLVGGIGVMNIMLVSVQERTKEIGIRLALGATQYVIQLQFLQEAVILSSIGGFIGVGLGLIGTVVISRITHLPAEIELLPMLGSLIITVMVGIFFGYYPARKASLLNPVDALLNRK